MKTFCKYFPVIFVATILICALIMTWCVGANAETKNVTFAFSEYVIPEGNILQPERTLLLKNDEVVCNLPFTPGVYEYSCLVNFTSADLVTEPEPQIQAMFTVQIQDNRGPGYLSQSSSAVPGIRTVATMDPLPASDLLAISIGP